MPIEAQGEVTRFLEEIAAAHDNEDSKRASDAKRGLFDHVYDELKKMAHCRMKRERPDHSWGATGLVHEVYLRLIECHGVFTKNRAYFFGAAAKAMHRLLREHARSKNCRPEGYLDRQGNILLDQVADEVEDTFRVVLLDLVNALEELKTRGQQGERRYDVARLRIWSGMKYSDIAKDLGISVPTVEREWQAARAWLYGQLKREDNR
jgi:RNA polymerase sigma factor (TIGR02999 family)